MMQPMFVSTLALIAILASGESESGTIRSIKVGAAPKSSPMQDRTHETAAAYHLPTRFLGEWNDDLTQCALRASEGRLIVTAGKLAFHDVETVVQRVTTLNPDAVKIAVSTKAEGRTWTSEMRLTLARSDADLTVSMAGKSLTRHRCSK